jgi:NAD(P)-dependent dehydrogenase (short-subunit alcohol dehydrogenase family)
MKQEFMEQVVLITGAGKGLGRAYAHWFAAAGAKVVVNNRVHPGVPSSAQAVVAEIAQLGGTAIAEQSSVETEDGAGTMIATALGHFGRIDALICNAGISEDVPFQTFPLEEMHRVMNINFWGSLYPLRAALPGMIASNFGRIVLSTSQAGLFGQRRATLYSASKAALIGLARGLALDLRKHDIHINLIAPAAYTPMASAKVDARWAQFMAPEKVAPLVGWMASRDCRHSGMIFNSGAGRVRRARIMECQPVHFDDDFASCLPMLDDMNGALEAKESYDSGRVLMPEMFSKDAIAPTIPG